MVSLMIGKCKLMLEHVQCSSGSKPPPTLSLIQMQCGSMVKSFKFVNLYVHCITQIKVSVQDTLKGAWGPLEP